MCISVKVAAVVAALDAGGQGVFTGSDPATDAVADSSGALFRFDQATINGSGIDAFSATFDAVGEGIFSGKNVVLDTVVKRGDLLDGMAQGSYTHVIIAVAYAGLGEIEKVEDLLPGIGTGVTSHLSRDENETGSTATSDCVRRLRVDMPGAKSTCD